MSERKLILAIDEQKAALDFIRSVLSLADDNGFEISWAPSAEEGLLELRQRPYDLLVAGLRLPGIDGLELTRRARQLWPEIPVILSSFRPLSEWRDQAAMLGVKHVLGKPLDAEEFLSAVHELLEDAPPVSRAPKRGKLEEKRAGIPTAAAQRLEVLRAETGAGQVLLVTVGGEVLHVTGSQLHPDLPRLVAAASASVRQSLDLSDQLAEEEPRAVQFLEGETCDLYWANVDRDRFVVILFDAQLRRGRIGTVWVFAQRAVAALQELLAEQPESGGPPETSPPATPDEPPPESNEPAREEVEATPPDDTEARRGETSQASPEEQEISPDAEESGPRSDPKLDAFWDQALVDESSDDYFTTAISLEEAKERGLIGDDFDPDDQ